MLTVTKVGDKSLVLHTLSSEWGRRSFIASASRKVPGGALQPLSLLEAEVQENPRSELWRLHSVSVPEPLAGIRSNLHKNAITMFMSEVLYRAVKDGEGGGGFFDWCRRSILTLDALESDFSNYHLRFLLELAVELA